jgi:lipopolysaccharide export system protein LptA
MRRKNNPVNAAACAARRGAALALATMALVMMGPVRAERADRDKPVNIESDRMTAEEAKKTAVFDGRVVLTQGTLTIRADRLVIRQDRDGFQQGTATGKPASFRQKRDGANEYIEGEAERIEYDGRSERIQFFDRAHLRRDTGDDVRGNYISYDTRTEFFTVQSSQEAKTPGQDNRVRAVIMPKKPAPESSPAAKPAPEGGVSRPQ